MDKFNVNLDDAALVALRKCGHFLHHSAGKGSEKTNAELLGALTEDEKKVLASLLEKCLKHWETL